MIGKVMIEKSDKRKMQNKSRKKIDFDSKSIIARLSVVGAAGIMLVSLSSCQSTKVAEKIPTVVNVEAVDFYKPKAEARYSAVIKPASQVDVAFKVGGYVDSIARVRGADGRMRILQEGDYVRAGTVLARVRAQDYTDRVKEQNAALDEVRTASDRMQASLAESQAALDQAKADFERTENLYQNQSATKPDYDRAKANFDMNSARVKAAEAQIAANNAAVARTQATLDQARINLSDCNLVSPISGVVVRRAIEIGSLAAGGSVGFTIADSDSVKIAFGVSDIDLSNLKMGDSVTVTSEAVPGKSFVGRISEIAAAADPKSRVFDVEVTLPNRTKELRIGMVAALYFAGAVQKPVLAVPLDAVVRSTTDPQGYSVYVAAQNAGGYVVEERTVQLGEACGHKIAVLSGVKKGDEVVTNGATRVVSGEEVRVLR